MRGVPSRPRGSGPLTVPPIGTGDLIVVLPAIACLSYYICLASVGAARVIIFSDCGLGRDEPYFDLYARIPLALAALAGLAYALRRLPVAGRITRAAALVSAGLWVWSVGISRGWW